MALAYAVILVDTRLFDRDNRDTVREAQVAADKRFEQVAQEARLTLVTRNPEPKVMTYLELRKAFPQANLDGLTGLYFTADIT